MPNIVKPTGMSTIWASAGTSTAPNALKISQGWVVELPPYQTANYIEKRQDQFNAHVNMHGVPQWDGETEYQGGVSYSKGSNGTVYKCTATHVNLDPTNPLNSNVWSIAFEPYGSVAVVAGNLATLQSSYNTLANLTSYPNARTNLSVFSKVESDIRFAPIAGQATQVFSVAPATLSHHAVRLDQISGFLVQATESTAGVAELASALETEAGTNDTNIVTPLKATTTFLKKSDNLSALSSAPAARTNLGLGTIAVEAATSFLRASNNLSDVPNKITARSNLGLGTMATEAAGGFLRTTNNLSDLTSASTARTNLGLGTIATEAATAFLRPTNNLSDLTNAPTARSNLGLTSTAIQAESYFLRSAQNLADLGNASTARSNLGLTSTATTPPETFVSNASMVGQVAMFAHATPPAGWLFCNGAAVSRATYAALFAAIGTTYGAGNGSTTFNVPNCLEEFPRGWNGSAGDVGVKFAGSVQSHSHTASSAASGSHTHTASTASDGNHVHGASTTVDGDHTHSKTYTYVAGGALNLGFIYNDPNVYHGGGDSRTSAGNKTMTTSSAGSHAHSVNVGLGGLHTHAVSVVAGGSHTHTVTVNATGGADTRPRGISFMFCIRY